MIDEREEPDNIGFTPNQGNMKGILFFSGMLCFFLNACALPGTSPGNAASGRLAVEFNKAQYLREKDSAGIVLISVNWSRQWGCGKFENAQLKKLAFDKSDSPAREGDSDADLVLENPFLISSPFRFINYAYLVPPGRYFLSGIKLKVARSIDEVGFFNFKRSNLTRDGKSNDGSFDVGPAEAVYIGHFFIKCAPPPIPWVFFPEDSATFNQYLNEIGKKYSSFPIENVKVRILENVSENPFPPDQMR